MSVQLAELFIRYRADMGNTASEVKRVDDSIAGVERSGGKAHVSMGRLRQEMVSLVRQTTGTSPVISQLGSVLGEMAIGGPAVTGILLGIGGITAVYQKLTAGAREAAKHNDELIVSLKESLRMKGLGAGGKTVDERQAVEDRIGELRGKRNALIPELTAAGNAPGVVAAFRKQIHDLNVEIADLQSMSNLAGREIKSAIKKAADGTPHVKALSTHVKTLAADFREAASAGQEFVARMAALRTPGGLAQQFGFEDLHQQTLRQAMEQLGPLPVVNGTVAGDTGGVFNQGTFDESKKNLENIFHATSKGTEILKGAIDHSAQIVGAIVGSALNLGGGGRGSQIGSVVGGAAGGILTAGMSAFGSSLGPLGAVAGAMLGSALGGLFHHKKSVDRNTDLLGMLNKTMDSLSNAPSGYKYAYARNMAAAPVTINGNVSIAPNSTAEIGKELRLVASRGGASPLLVAG